MPNDHDAEDIEGVREMLANNPKASGFDSVEELPPSDFVSFAEDDVEEESSK